MTPRTSKSLPIPAAAIVDTVREPLVILDAGLRVVQANLAFYQTFRVTSEETEGSLLYDIGARGWDIPRLRTLLGEILPRHNTFNDFEVEHDFPSIGQKVLLLNARCVIGERQPPEFILLAIEDITERRRAERGRHEAESLFTSLVKNLQDHAIFMLDPVGRITSWNVAAHRVIGYTEQEAIGENFSVIFTPEEIQQGIPQRELQTASQEGRCEDERWHVRKGGELFWALGIVSPMRDGAGVLIGFSKVLRDLSERKRAEELLGRQAVALKEADRRKDEFLAVLSHELRNPMAPIRNAVRVMHAAGEDRAVVEQARQIIERQVHHMDRLIEDLLDVSRIVRGQITMKKERVELASVVSVSVETTRSVIEASGHRLTTRLPNVPVVLEADPSRLAQVLTNLLANAAKYTLHGGQIWLTAESVGGEVTIHVRDNGVGIAADKLRGVFDMFTQVAASVGLSLGGLGIGLAVAKSIVEMHGGTIQATSPGLGQGSEFVVSLPLLREAQGPARHGTPAASREEVAAPTGLKILVVDDNKDSAESLAMLLRLTGNSVRTADDGPTAVQAAREFVPDAILLDIGLPGMSGHEVARTIRREPSLRGVLLIAQTGWGNEEDRLRSRDAGFDHHLVKPVDLSSLQKLLASIRRG